MLLNWVDWWACNNGTNARKMMIVVMPCHQLGVCCLDCQVKKMGFSYPSAMSIECPRGEKTLTWIRCSSLSSSGFEDCIFWINSHYHAKMKWIEKRDMPLLWLSCIILVSWKHCHYHVFLEWLDFQTMRASSMM